MSGVRGALLGVAVLALAACGTTTSAGTSTAQPAPPQVRLGFLTTLTHAPALIGVTNGYFQQALPSGTRLQTMTFSAGPAENEALAGGSLDAAFVGPNPAINAYQKTNGGVRVVAGAASGGAGLVVAPAIADGAFPSDLKGQTLASPQLGNTQDVALRAWLAQHGLSTSATAGGDVSVDATSGSALDLQRFEAGQLAGAWLPEPYESSMIVSGHGKLVVDEASLWPGSRYPTTLLVVTATLLQQHPDIVTDLLRGLMRSLSWLAHNPTTAADTTANALATVTGSKPLAPAVLAPAWSRLSFGSDPLASDLQVDADHAKRAGLISSSTITGIVALGPLNSLLAASGQAPVSSAGIGS